MLERWEACAQLGGNSRASVELSFWHYGQWMMISRMCGYKAKKHGSSGGRGVKKELMTRTKTCIESTWAPDPSFTNMLAYLQKQEKI